MRSIALAVAVATLSSCTEKTAGSASKDVAATAAPDASVPVAGPRLLEVGPRFVSNQTSQPLALYGEQLEAGPLTVTVKGPDESPITTLSIPTVKVDARHLYARLPPVKLPAAMAEAVATLTLAGAPSKLELRLINDQSFPELVALAQSNDGKWLFAASQTEDALYAFEVASKKVTRIEVLDGPSALATFVDAQKKPWLVVAHRFAPSLLLVSQEPPFTEKKEVPVFNHVSALAADGDTLFVAEQARDTVAAYGLSDLKEKWRTPVLANPRVLQPSPKGLYVGSEETGLLERLDPKTGAALEQVTPVPGTPIIGGGTAAFSAQIMGGSAPRAFAWSKKLDRLYVASIGPNIGPNEKKMEVSMNGGVGVVAPPANAKRDPSSSYLLHLGFGAGVTEALALDDARGVLYAADVSLGLVRVLDLKKLSSPGTAGQALLAELALPPPDDFPLIRPKGDFVVNNRAGVSLHSGPWALALSPDQNTLWVLNRFTATVARLDVKAAAQSKAQWVEQTQLTSPLTQPVRRKGEVLYFADLGRTAMSCDACHPDGHMGDVMFEKTHPLRFYRVPTVRGSRFSPPYFTPASTHSMGETAEVVGSRNRFQNPKLTVDEINALSIYGLDLTLLPNPFVQEDGAPPEQLALPDGKVGHPRAGIAAFEKAQCKTCHPPPHFTSDQDQKTRGWYLDAGTPELFPLRTQWQNPTYKGFAPPPLAGSWDVWPMLTTGLGGWSVTDGGVLQVDDRYPARAAVTKYAPIHGRADLLNGQEVDDLLAWLMTL
ncbi:MAG: MtsA protein [Myxococcaceae bacterium]